MGETEVFPDGIYTGFLADEEQADKILDFFSKRFRTENTMVLVDPVMGDNGRAYGIYTEGLREKMLQLVGKRPCDYAQSYGSSASFIWERRDGKRYASLLETGWKEKAGTDRKDWGAAEKEYGLQAAVITGVESRAGICVYIRWEIW